MEVTRTDGTKVEVGGAAFAEIVVKPAVFKALCEQQSGSASYQLLACESGKLNKPGGSAFDFQQALSKLGHGGTVFAPTGMLGTGSKPGPSSPFTVVFSNGSWAEFNGQVPAGTSANEPTGPALDETNVGGGEAEESDTTWMFEPTEEDNAWDAEESGTTWTFDSTEEDNAHEAASEELPDVPGETVLGGGGDDEMDER
ncbi:hypothetical protein [Saccharopolyspora sp. NPDC050642]|uniref:hypothetical protein n=1 Tax=Saccharopolyspora sp. NPDC050642 TaxID=3157099 RepID=UPI0033E5CB49